MLSIETHLTLWCISLSFVAIYFMYDKNKLFKTIGDALLFFSFWHKDKSDILLFALPLITISILSIILDVFVK